MAGSTKRSSDQPARSTDDQVKRSPRATWTLAAGFGFLLSTGVAVAAAWIFLSRPYGVPPFPRQVEIPRGASLRTVSSVLERQGVVRSRWGFMALAILKGDQGRIRAGEYRFEGPCSSMEVLARLTTGKVLLHQVTLPEGWTAEQIARRLHAEGLLDETRFMQEVRDPALVSKLMGLQAPSLEGFLFPDTYRFSSGLGEDRIIRVLTDRFHEAFDPSLQARAKEIGWSTLQVVTLASLIEKETSIAAERPIISGVFHRRLRLGMPLASDPSVIYGLEGFSGNLRRQDLRATHPYNTYINTGLPPGPICNPGRDALVAALFPARTDYLYFVSRNDGSHHFSRTYREHRRAVARYQKNRR